METQDTYFPVMVIEKPCGKARNRYPEDALETRQLVYVIKKQVLFYSGHFFSLLK